MDEYEYDKFPEKFTESYLKDRESETYRETDYDDDIDSENDYDKKYIEHFFQLNNWLKFSFRFYPKKRFISYIYIMDDDGDGNWDEFYEFKILNKLIPEFNIEKNLFNWDFDFKKYEIKNW